jgi:hypothetical protein
MIELIPITDPNQLTLGIESQVLTTEQQERLQRNVDYTNRMAEKQAATLLNQRALLLGAGFTEDEFEYELKESTIVRTFDLSGWREPEVKAEAEVKDTTGHCYIKFDCYNTTTGEIESRNAGFSLEGGHKVTCSKLVGSFRAVKIETLKQKVQKKAQDANYNQMADQRGKDMTSQTIEKYSKLCPTATVAADEVWLNSRTCKVIKVTFPNGSFIDLETGYEFGRERILRFVDVKTNGLDPEQLAAYFNAQ